MSESRHDPVDLESEEALLGAILIAPALAKKAQVDGGDFYKPTNGKIWEAAKKCAGNGGADIITVAAELERRGQLEEIGGKDRIAILASSCPAPGNAGAYAKRVKEKAQLRAQRKAALRILEAIDNEDLGKVSRAIESLGNPILYIDTESGEIVEDCPKCSELDAVLKKKEIQSRQDLAKISRLEGKAEKQARQHKLWDEVAACFEWYKLATGHLKVTFTAEHFAQALPRWKEESKGKANPCIAVLHAIAGIAFDPSKKKGRNGRPQVFDSWELLMRSQEKFLDFQSRAPGAPDTQEWKLALVRMIEANFKETAKP